MQIKDITGLRFGRLVATKSTEQRSKQGAVLWLCKCDCGNETIVSGRALRRGQIKSCGCLKIETDRKKGHDIGLANRKHFGCLYCGSDKHYAKGCCQKCYARLRRGTLE